jgi:BlaI family transcriptional regulator, penicillinase repressor
VQMRIMQVLWKKQRATAREITDTLNEFEPIAHSTVQTLIRTLEFKKAVSHDIESYNRTFVFYPLIQNESVVHNALNEFVNKMFNGSMEGLVSYLVREEHISPEEKKRVADTLISRLFGGSAEELVAYLIKNNYLTSETLKKLCVQDPNSEKPVSRTNAVISEDE